MKPHELRRERRRRQQLERITVSPVDVFAALFWPALILLLLLASQAKAQPFIETKAGLSSRLSPVATIDAGTMIRPTSAYSGMILAATTGYEAGFGASYGGYVGWQFYAISLNAGATAWLPTNTKLENNKSVYPLVSVQYRAPQNRAVFDLRYMGNSIMITMGFRFGRNHNE